MKKKSIRLGFSLVGSCFFACIGGGYFVQKDQVEDLANRKGVLVEEADKYLKVSLGYKV